MDVHGKKVLILGIGASGIDSARFLRKQGAQVFLSEGRSTERTEQAKRELLGEGFEIEVGTHSESRIAEADFVVISPGIAPSSPVYALLLKHKKDIFSEIEVASWFCRLPYVGVTGTNGKTTVTTLIAKMLTGCGRPAISCGNIGNTFIGELDRINAEGLIPVIELSSFQLMHIRDFRPHVGVLLNLDPDHLDWHKDLDEYYDAKFRMFMNQDPSDFAVLNAQDAASRERLGKVPSRVLWFGASEEGDRNPNVSACLAAVEALGLVRDKALEVLMDFKGIEHRLEEVPSGDGRLYVNDSKSTNISSLVWALERQRKPAVLIIGGKNKGGDFTRIKDLIHRKVKAAVLIGVATPEIEPALSGNVPYVKAATLREAIEAARSLAEVGETVLLSPGCASFDMFINYKDRGEQFKSLVAQIAPPCPKPVSVS